MLIVLAYFLLQTNRIRSDQMIYSLLNLLGASGVVFSLMFDWNLPSFIVESFWVVISMIGVVRCCKSRASANASKEVFDETET